MHSLLGIISGLFSTGGSVKWREQKGNREVPGARAELYTEGLSEQRESTFGGAGIEGFWGKT